MFQNQQRQFYEELNQYGEKYDHDQPDAEESKNFGSGLVDHNRGKKYLKGLQSEVNVTKQEKI